VEVSSNPGDVVLDPFMGGGSTGLACKDREFIGVELNPDYFTLALQKLTY
jgi:site-specific DNA-methyltransferase (adenine-specific)